MLHDRIGRVTASATLVGILFLGYVGLLIVLGDPGVPAPALLRAVGAVLVVAGVVAFGADVLLARGTSSLVVVLLSLGFGAGAGATLLVGTGHPTSGEETNGLVFLSAGCGLIGLVSALVIVLLGTVRRRSGA